MFHWWFLQEHPCMLAAECDIAPTVRPPPQPGALHYFALLLFVCHPASRFTQKCQVSHGGLQKVVAQRPPLSLAFYLHPALLQPGAPVFHSSVSSTLFFWCSFQWPHLHQLYLHKNLLISLRPFPAQSRWCSCLCCYCRGPCSTFSRTFAHAGVPHTCYFESLCGALVVPMLEHTLV